MISLFTVILQPKVGVGLHKLTSEVQIVWGMLRRNALHEGVFALVE